MPSPFVSMKWGHAEHLTRALFDQGDIWVTATSQVRKIKDMSAPHVLNTLLMIERMDDLPIDNLHNTKLYQALYDRLLSFLPKEAGATTGRFDASKPNVSVWAHNTGTLFKRVGVDREAIESILEAAIAAREHMTEMSGERAPEVIIDYTDAHGVTTRGRRVIPKQILRGAFSREARTLHAYDLEKREPRHFLIDRIQRCEDA